MKKNISKERNIKVIIMLFLLSLWLVCSGIYFIFEVNKDEVADFETELRTASKNNANAVEFTFHKYTSFLQIAGDAFHSFETKDADFDRIVNNLVDFEDFSGIALVFPDGTSYFTRGTLFIPSTYKFTEQMANLETYVSDLYYDPNLRTSCVSINLPLIGDDKKLHGYIVGILSYTMLSHIFDHIFYDVGGYFNIIDSNGFYLAASVSENMLLMDVSFIEAARTVDMVDGYNPEDVRNAFSKRTDGLVRYRFDGFERTAYYTPIGINNWVMFSVVPQELIDKEMYADYESTSILIVNILLISGILIVWIYRSQRSLKSLAEDNEKNFRFVSEQTNKYIVECDFIKDTVKITGKLKAILGEDINVLSIDQDVFHNLLHVDDMEKTQNAFFALENGRQISDIKIRIKRDNGTFIWCVFSAVPVSTGKRSKVYSKAIGFLENIDEQEKEAALLRSKSELDSLTKIYNKGTTEEKIEAVIRNSSPASNRHTLVIIDMDNFKMLNDTFGHQYGDEVLKELADYLKNTFRHDDILGRIGGDEFFVFVRDAYTSDLISTKCDNILEHFAKTYEENGKSVSISISMGIAIYSKHGTKFEELYRNADLALYKAKKQGKNKYCFYDGEADMDYVSNRTVIDSINNARKHIDNLDNADN